MRALQSKIQFITWLIIAVVVMTGCGGIGFVYQKQLSGKYELVAVDTLEQMDISVPVQGGAIEVVPSTIFAVGWNKDFIIAKQHPNSDKHVIDRSITNYYILRVADEKVIGPLDAGAFELKRTELGVQQDLSFSLVFESLK